MAMLLGCQPLGGEVFFDECYNVNPLVNAMSVGILKVGESVSATSHGEGNPVYIIGSSTGKDGIHGATFASADITEDSAESLPSVQVGDPFMEKLLLEASLEIIKTGAVVGMQDMGAAGITCSTSEMSAKGNSGMIIHLDRVPLRQQNMLPFEILLSESQERMLVIVKKGREKEVEAVLEKWDLHYAVIGEVTSGDRLKYYVDEELVADVPAPTLVLGGGAPVYKREFKEPAYYREFQKFNMDDIKEPTDYKEVAQYLLTHPNIASKKWVYEQYDSMVGTINMSSNKPSDAAIVNVKKTDSALALKVDCNSRYVYADPYKGGAIAVAEAARNIVCSGGEPIAITNCLNFGNPYNPEVYWQFVEAIKGIGEACTKFNTPVTGGNVSFYNQSSFEGPVFPTPVIGMLGIVKDKSKIMTLDFKNEGNLIYLVGECRNDINSSEYLYSWHNVKGSPAPYVDLSEEYGVQSAVKDLVEKGLIESAHDCSDGGLFVTLAESAMAGNLGFDIDTDSSIRKDAFLFGEGQSRVVVTVKPENEDAFTELLLDSAAEFSFLGIVDGNEMVVDGESLGNVGELKEGYDSALGKRVES